MKPILFILLSVVSLFAQLPREAPPSLDSYLSLTDADIKPMDAVVAPRVEGSLQGIPVLDSIRSIESIVGEVQTNQTKLSYLYKKAVFNGHVIPRYYDLTLTINKNGDVESFVVKGITDKEFLFDMSAIVKSWSFHSVREVKSKTVNLKHLDFLYRHELVME